jgi:hypothetical protein
VRRLRQQRLEVRSVHAAREVALLFAARFVSAGIVAVLLSMVASLYYVDIKGVESPSEVMRDRPNAPGSAAAVLASHSDRCWTTDRPKGVTTGALIRVHPNDPFIYVSSVEHKRGRLFIHALEQQFEGKERGIDTVLAFCTDRPTG